jgi:predicted acyl esterase
VHLPRLQDTDVIVRVSDVYPDGRSILILDYAQRARYRHGFDHQELLTPGAGFTGLRGFK